MSGRRRLSLRKGFEPQVWIVGSVSNIVVADVDHLGVSQRHEDIFVEASHRRHFSLGYEKVEMIDCHLR